MLQYLGTQEQSRWSKRKRDKYQNLRIELRRPWDKPVEIIPITIGVLGPIPKVPKEESRRFRS